MSKVNSDSYVDIQLKNSIFVDERAKNGRDDGVQAGKAHDISVEAFDEEAKGQVDDRSRKNNLSSSQSLCSGSKPVSNYLLYVIRIQS